MEALVAVEPADSNNLRQLGVAYQKLANSLGNPNYPNVGDYAGALDYLQRSGDVFRKASSLYPANALFRRNAGIVDSNTADVLTALNRPEEALARQRQAQRVFSELSSADPANVAALNDVAISRFKLAQMQEAAGQPMRRPANIGRPLRSTNGCRLRIQTSRIQKEVASD